MIVATRNYARFLPEALDSALGQSVPPREVVVVDDDSEDDTPSVLRRYGSEIRAIRQEHGGQGAAWNRGFLETSGEWIAFLDADDGWAPERVRRCLEAAGPEVGVVMHDLEVVGEAAQHPSWVGWTAVDIRQGRIGEELVRGGLPWVFTPTSGFMIRRRVLERILPLEARRWPVSADAPVLHLAAQLTAIRYLPERLGFYRVHGANFSNHQGWYDGNDRPKLILDNLWRLQRTAFEVNRHLAGTGSRDRVCLWNNPYYARMIGWVAGRSALTHGTDLLRRQGALGRFLGRGMRTELYRIREGMSHHRQRSASLGDRIREMARQDFPDLDLENVWEPSLRTPSAPPPTRSGRA